MINRYGILDRDLKKIRDRDKKCVYCHKKMTNLSTGGYRGDWATIEHLNHLPPWDNINTIAICCGSCNSSRGAKKLLDWFKSSYCTERNINKETVAEPVQEYIMFVEDFVDKLLWTFAKTMSEIPHYYVVRDSLSIDEKKTFDSFGKYIKRKGYSELFYSKSYDYLDIGDYKYWIMENILNRTKLNKKDD